MESKARERVMLLEEEVKSLSEELIQCQADKDFVWSLWKRLQVANPDLTQAVSLVVEREKQKAETKDRKVLEILQAKDFKIQELEKEVAAQRQELGGVGQRRQQTEEECGLMKKELAGLRHKLADKSRQLQEVEECKRVSEERERSVQGELEEVRRSLHERCNVLQQELLTEQQNRNLQQENHNAQVQELQEELVRLRAEQQEELVRLRAEQQEELVRLRSEQQEELVRLRAEQQEEMVRLRAKLLEVQGHNAALSSQLCIVEQQSSDREQQLQKLRRELVELQALYRQSVEHAGEQAELIKQLEGLNLDTQNVLRSQEQAHCTDTASYQKLYTELTASHQAFLRREDELRQRDTVLTAQLQQKDQQISQLQAELQQLQQQLRDRTSKAVLQQYAELQSSTPIPQSQDEEATVGTELPAQPLTSGTQGSSPEQSSRRSRAETEGRIQQLEELLSLKTQENEELKRAHAKRHNRLRLIQTNYRAVKEQLREVEDVQDQPKGRRKRAEPWQLRQENSDAVWNELAFFKLENRKLLNEKVHLEEELDVARVHVAMDRATAQELRLRLQEKQELQLRDGGNPAAGSALILPSAQRLDKSIKKIEVLERKMVCLEREAEQLRDDNHALQEAGEMLTRERSDLQAALKRASAREEAELDRLRVQLLGEVQALEARLQSCRKEAAEARRDQAQARHALLHLRQELGVLRAERDFHRAAAHRWSKANRTRLPTTRARGPTRTHTHPERRLWSRSQSRTHTFSEQRQQRTRSPAKDEWEDMSPDSETEEFSDSLESQRPAHQRKPSAAKGCRYELIAPRLRLRDPITTHQPHTAPGPVRSDLRKMRMKNSTLHQRLLCLQQQVAVLQIASRAATEKHTQTQTELETLTNRLQTRKQLSQKQACELAVLQQQKAVLEVELEQWRKSHSSSQGQLQPTVTPDPAHPTCTTITSAMDSAHPTIKQLEADIKQLNSKLKSATSEGNKQSSVIKGLKTELHDRDQRLKELQDKLNHAERDVVMKRQLVEDLRSRMKVLQDSESSRRALIDDLEKKVKTLVEEASNRKAFIESLKRRLSVASQEKSQSESNSQKLREDLQKRDQKLAALQVRLAECEGSRAELEEKVYVQVQAVSQQHSDTLQTLQNKLSLAQCQQEQLRSFTQALVVELSREVQESRAELRKRRRERKKRERADRGVSRSSMQKAQSIAASILNLTHTDLANILDTDQEEEEADGGGGDWMDHIRHVLQQQVPSAAVLVELVLEKLKEFRLLTEELAVFSSTVSENV